MLKTIIKQIASLQIILGIVIFVPALVALIYQEWYSLIGFALSGIVITLLGIFIYKALKNTNEPQYKHALIIAALGWLMVMLVGAVPYFVIANVTPYEIMQQFVPPGMDYESSLINFKNPLHCVFESTSAFTTTGLTMSYHEPSVGKSILFYRSLSNWVGGAGFIVMALAMFKMLPGQSALLLYGSEASGTKIRTNVIETTRAIWKVYMVITLLIFVYLVVGTYFILPDYAFSENLFDAVNHAMAAISTGGFSTLDDSIATYNSEQMDWLFILPMLIGGFSLPFLYRFIFLKKFSALWKDLQTRSLIVASIIGGFVLSFFLIHSAVVEDGYRIGFFKFIIAITTTGLQT